MKSNHAYLTYGFVIIFLSYTLHLQASTLKIYNMTDKPIYCSTRPIAQCDSSDEYCIAKPYQSIFRPNILLFELPYEGIEQLTWKRVGSRLYRAFVNLHDDEFATLTILGDGYYKFKGKKLYAEEL